MDRSPAAPPAKRSFCPSSNSVFGCVKKKKSADGSCPAPLLQPGPLFRTKPVSCASLQYVRNALKPVPELSGVSAARPPTVPVPFSLATDRRSYARNLFRERLREQERAAQVARAREEAARQAQERREIQAMRRQMTFRARPYGRVGQTTHSVCCGENSETSWMDLTF